MNAALHETRRESPPQVLRRLFWSYPEWWVVAGAGLSWLLMVNHSISHWGHEHHHMMGFGEETGHWVLMIGAMMLPLTLEPVRITAFRSLRERRTRAMIGFLAGYLGLWLLAGLPVVWLHSFDWSHSFMLPAVFFALATLWLLAPYRRRALAACHRTIPLSPTGLRADAACGRYGGVIGVACITTCWPIMAACALTGHSLVAMVAGTGIAALERLSFRVPVRVVFVGHLVLAGWFGWLAVG